MVCMYYDGDPPMGSVGCMLWCSRQLLARAQEVGLDVYLWDVSSARADDWRKGLSSFGVPDRCELPVVVLHAASRTYRYPLKSLEGCAGTQPVRVLQAMQEVWPSGVP